MLFTRKRMEAKKKAPTIIMTAITSIVEAPNSIHVRKFSMVSVDFRYGWIYRSCLLAPHPRLETNLMAVMLGRRQ
jgi:hypothetical protein